MDLISKVKSFGGWQYRYSHFSEANRCDMVFSIYLPPQADSQPVPVLYWLSGLTCTDENFVTKAGAQRLASEYGVAVVAPDTSPRGDQVPDDPEEAYDFGKGAGFYLNATETPWSDHYQMYDYISSELPALIEKEFPVTTKKSIFGHSMGGHGALVIYLKNVGGYQSVSAFAPITNPTQCPWGEKAFTNYLGNDKSKWLAYDACELLKSQFGNSEQNVNRTPILVSQGLQDDFLENQLYPENLKHICEEIDYRLILKLEEGYDHSYYFIASFLAEHFEFHANWLYK